jgi:endonuclease/exonuclease/phosphatase (EEP) superfamily protein YafD
MQPALLMRAFGRPLTVLLGLVLALALSASQASASAEAQRCASALGGTLSGQESHLDTSVSVLSWNIQKASNTGWQEDLAALAGNIHLAFIQEAAVQAAIAQSIPSPLYQAFAAGYTTDEVETGVLTLSTSTPSLHCNLTAWEPWLGTPKATSITEHPIRGRSERLLAVNMHAVNFAVGLEEFRAQIHAIGAVLDNHRGPIIVAGDLNTWSEGRQALVDEFMSQHGLLAVQFAPDLRTTAFGRALDHIYVRGLSPAEARVVPVSSSDHNPLLVRLQIL